MGFLMGYPVFFIPKLLLYTLTFLGFIIKLISCLFKVLGLGGFLESDITLLDRTTHLPLLQSISAVMIREILPVVKFEELIIAYRDTLDCCAFCLREFEAKEEIRPLTNCTHIFHRSCLDHWMDHDQTTCPLCRASFIPDSMQPAFNKQLWAASGIPDYGE